MAKIICVASQKGGVGKTTTALNLSYILAMMGEKALLLDGDPQGGVAIASNLGRRTNRGLVDVLLGQCEPGQIVAAVKNTSLSIAGIGVMDPENVVLFEQSARDGRLGKLIADLATGYDYVFLDAPAGVGEVVRALFMASDSSILTVRPRNLSIKSIPPFLKLVKWVKQNHERAFKIEGVAVTMYDEASALEVEVLSRIRSIIPEDLFFKTVIPFNEMFEKASMKALPIALLSNSKKPTQAYKELALEIKAREPLATQGGPADDDTEGLF